MKKYVIGTIVLGIFLTILSVANLFETILSKHRTRQVFKNIDQQYDVIGDLKNEVGVSFSSSNQIDLLGRFNREIEANIVFLNANNNRRQVHSIALLVGVVILCSLALRLYSLSKRRTST